MKLNEPVRKPFVLFVGGIAGLIIGVCVAALVHDAMGYRTVTSIDSLLPLPFIYFTAIEFRQFHDRHGWRLAVGLPAVIAPLRTPAQRVWFLVAVVGLLLIGASMVFYSLLTPYRYGEGALDGFLDLTFDRFHFWSCPYRGCSSARVFQCGLALLIFGGLFAYRYDSTLGAAISWIRQGQRQSRDFSDSDALRGGAPAAAALTQAELSALYSKALLGVRDRWLYFVKTIHFRDVTVNHAAFLATAG